MINQEKSENPSRYRFAMSEKCGRPAIMDKYTDEILESFSLECDEAFVIQRLREIREDEIMRNRIVAGTSLENATVTQGGLII